MQKGLGELKIYRLSLSLSKRAWAIYTTLPQDIKFSTGRQFLSAIDSIGANIAEGFGRFYFKDKIRFFYNARGSLWESKHWVYLLESRELIGNDDFQLLMEQLERLGKQLNSFIAKIKGTHEG